MSDVKIVVGAQDNASRVLAQVRSSMADVQMNGAKLAGVLGSLGVAFSASAATEWVRTIVDGVDALNDLKDATGSSIENISALEDIAARTGTSFETVGSALIKFNKLLNDAKPGSEAEASLNALGLSAKKLRDIDPAEALLQYSQAISNFADDGNKARLVQDQLGKSYRELAPFLKDLAEAGQLNATVTTQQADEAEKFNKQLFQLEKNAKDAGRALTADFVTGINKAADAMRNSGFWEGLRTLMTGDDQYKSDKRLVELTDQLLQAENNLSKSRADDAKYGDKSLRTAAAERRLALLKEELATVQNYRKVLAGVDSSTVTPDKPSIGGLPEKGKLGKPKSETITDEQRALASYVQSLQNELTTTEKLTEQQKALNFLKSLGTTGEIAQVRELVLGQAQLVDSLQAQTEATKALNEQRQRANSYFEGLARELQAQEEANQKLREQVEEIGLTTEALDALRLARLDAAIATEEQTRAQMSLQTSSEEEIAVMERRIALLKEQRELTASGQVRQAQADSKAEQEKASKEYADTLRNDLKGAFSAAFRDSKDPLQAFGDALENVIFSRASTALSESAGQFLEQLASSSFGGDGGGSDIFSWAKDLLSFDGGGYTGTGGRTGGLDGKGGFLSLLHPQESVIDHTRGQSVGGGSVNIYQTINIDSRSDQATIIAAMTQAKEMAKAEILSSRARGGVFA